MLAIELSGPRPHMPSWPNYHCSCGNQTSAYIHSGAQIYNYDTKINNSLTII